MITKRIIPCLDVKNGRVVKGVNFEGLHDVSSPIELAEYYTKSGADELVFYDITASAEGRGLFTDILRETASRVFIPLTVGGGINTLDDFDRVLKCGADKVSVNSGAIRDPDLIRQAALRYGSQCVVLSADVKRVDGQFRVFGRGGRDDTGMEAIAWIKKCVDLGAGEIVVNGEPAKEKRESIWKDVFAGIVSNKASLVSGIFILLLIVIALVTKFVPSVLPYDPYAQNLSESLLGPSAQHWFGTDIQGRDIFCRVLVGTQITLTVGLAAVAISLTVGVLLGSIAGYKGGKADTVIMRIMDMMLAIPSILLAIAIMAALGPGIEKAVVAIGLVAIPEYARIVRSEILSIKENDYVAAARVIGDSNFKIVFKHVLPNVLPSIIVRATLGISTAILDAAALGFLGLGVQPPAAEWGDMLGRGRNELFRAPWLMIFPGLAITLTVLAFNLLGDGVRDGLDPKARKR